MKTVKGNILNETRGILVHGVNCSGGFGSGLAGQIKNKYPEVYRDYWKCYNSALCDPESMMYGMPGELLLGTIFITPITGQLLIISGFTQVEYGRDSNICYANYHAIETVFKRVNEIATNLTLPVIFPKIGAGLANGDWWIIESIINNTLDPKLEKKLFVLD